MPNDTMRLTDELQAAKKDALQLRIALKHLVELKDYKDKYGKDSFYELHQPIAWDVARDLLNDTSNDDAIRALAKE